jgi:hypothetical protein
LGGGVLSLEIAAFPLSHCIVLYAFIWPLSFLLSGKYCAILLLHYCQHSCLLHCGA